jgi:hypothetical protein
MNVLTFIVDQELVETTARRHHRKDGNLPVSDDLQQSRALLLNEPLQLGLDIRGPGDTLSGNAHGAGKRDKVGVLLVGVGVTVLVEQVLPVDERVSLGVRH